MDVVLVLQIITIVANIATVGFLIATVYYLRKARKLREERTRFTQQDKY